MENVKINKSGNRKFWGIIFFLWLVGIIIRIGVFLTTEYYVDAGESVVGLMARDILHGKYFPILLYGHGFEGGGAFMAYLAVPFLWLLGFSSFSLKLISFFTFTLTLVVGCLWIRRHCNDCAAIYFTSIIAVSPPLYTIWSLRVYGTHDIIFLLLFGMFWLHWEILYKGKNTVKGYFLFGLYCGFAVWMHAGVIIGVFVCLLFSYLQQKDFLNDNRLDAFLLGGLLMGLPLLIFNLQNDWVTIEWLKTSPYQRDPITNYHDLLVQTFPRTLGWSNDTNWKAFHDSIDVGALYGIFCYIITLSLLCYFVIIYRKEFITLFRRLFSIRWLDSWVPSQPVILVCYAVLWFFIGGASTWASHGIHYGLYCYMMPFFLPFFVGLPMTAAKKRASGKSTLFFQICFWMVLTGSFLFNVNHIYQGAALRRSKDEFKDVLKLLYQINQQDIYTNMWANFRLRFESDGYFRTSDAGITNQEFKIYSMPHFYYPEKATFVIANPWGIQNSLDSYLRQYHIPHKEKHFSTIGRPADWTVYYSFDTPLRPWEAFSFGDISKLEIFPNLRIRSSHNDLPNGDQLIPFRIRKPLVNRDIIPPYWSAPSPAWIEVEFPSPQWIDYVQIQFPDFTFLGNPYSPQVWNDLTKEYQPGRYPQEYQIEVEYWDISTKKYVSTSPISLLKTSVQGCAGFTFNPVQSNKMRFLFQDMSVPTSYIYVSDIACKRAVGK